MKMKGQEAAPMILVIAVLGILFMAILMQYNWGWSWRDWKIIGTSDLAKNTVQVSLNHYSSLYTLKAARAYLRTSLEFSVYQAMYDNGRNGGYSSPQNTYTFPDESVLSKELSLPVFNSMDSYVKQDFFFNGVRARLPYYTVEKIATSFDDGSMTVQAESNDMISNYRESEIPEMGAVVELSISSKISREFGSRYVDLYKRAASENGRLKAEGCGSPYQGTKQDGQYLIEIKQLEKTDQPCRDVLEVTLTDTSVKYPVFNGKEAAFEYVVFSFPLTRQ